MTDIQFATPALLLLLPVVLLIALLPLYARERTRPPSLRFASTFAARTQSRSLKLRLRPFVPVLRWLALALLIIAAARPQTTDAREILRGEGIDITLALDISGSMAAFDFDPINRLEAAKQVIYEFIERREYDRIGLIVFASEAFVHSRRRWTTTRSCSCSKRSISHRSCVCTTHCRWDGPCRGRQHAQGLRIREQGHRPADRRCQQQRRHRPSNRGRGDRNTRHPRLHHRNGKPRRQARPAAFRLYQGRSRRGDAPADSGQHRRQVLPRTDTDGLRTIYEEIDKLEKSEVEVSIYAQHRSLRDGSCLRRPSSFSLRFSPTRPFPAGPMTFQNAQYLILLAALPVAVAIIALSIRKRTDSMRRIGDHDLVTRLARTANTRGRMVRRVLILAALGLAVVALARPQWGESSQIVERRGIQLIVALDISKSMLAEDLKPNRLERAKFVISDLIGHLTGDEFGLVIFSGSAFVQFPLTFDYATARTFLDKRLA